MLEFVLLLAAAGAVVWAFSSAPRILPYAVNLSGSWGSRPVSGITDITLHHTAAPASYGIEEINNGHKGRGWPGIAYHYVIDQGGRIFQTNPAGSLTWHNGYNNSVAIGVVMLGDFTKTRPTNAQISSFVWLARTLKKRYPSIRYLVGHKEYPGASTLCPGDIDLIAIRRRVALPSRSGGAAKVAAALSFNYDAKKADN